MERATNEMRDLAKRLAPRGEKPLRGRRVVAALCERARELRRSEVRVAEVYDWNETSQRCFAAAGFSPYERTERGSRWRRAL